MSTSEFYEVSTRGDRRFSALVARLRDGRTIEEAYQLDVKGYRKVGNDWRIGKGRPPLDKTIDVRACYLALWRQWANENSTLIEELRSLSRGKILHDRFAKPGRVSQAEALTIVLSETEL